MFNMRTHNQYILSEPASVELSTYSNTNNRNCTFCVAFIPNKDSDILQNEKMSVISISKANSKAKADDEPETPTETAVRRVHQDILVSRKEILEGIHIHPDEKNIMNFHVVIEGPHDTPYEGGMFYFHIRMPYDYPWSPPQVRLHSSVEWETIHRIFICAYFASGKAVDNRRWNRSLQPKSLCKWQGVPVDFGHMGRTAMDTGHEFALGAVIHSIADEQRAVLQRARLY